MEKLIGGIAGGAVPALTAWAGGGADDPKISLVAFAVGIILGAGSIFATAKLGRRR